MPASTRKNISWPDIVSSVLILLFIYTAFSKMLDFRFFKSQISLYPVLKNAAGFIAILIPLLEFFAVALLFRPASRLKGLYASCILLLSFTSYLFMMILLKGKALPCSCGGIIGSLSWKQHVFLNIGLMILTLSGILVSKNIQNPSSNKLA